ncbi:MAG: ATP synthase F1 subunit delta [Sulfurovum sp.]|nr:MAG: ATP synthase F1 subunit delta [Sulfurovum sp.]
MEELIANRYVNALVDVTSSEQRAEFSNVLSNIAKLFDDAKILESLTSPLIKAEQKTSFILDGLGKECDLKLQNFIKIIGENGRLDLLPVISKKLHQAIQKESNNYEGIVLSSSTLPDSEIANLEASLKTYTGSTIKLTQKESDLDGIKVSVEDLGIEVNFSKQRVKEQLIDFITKSL